MEIVTTIKERRVAAGRSVAETAAALGVTPYTYEALEEDDAEIDAAISLRQARRLAALLNVDLLTLCGEQPSTAPIPLAAVRKGMNSQFGASAGSREQFEDLIDWDMGPFLDGQTDWETVYTVGFIKKLAKTVGAEWGDLIAGLPPL